MGRRLLAVLCVLLCNLSTGQGHSENWDYDMTICTDLGLQHTIFDRKEDGNKLVVFCQNSTDGAIESVVQIGLNQVSIIGIDHESSLNPQT